MPAAGRARSAASRSPRRCPPSPPAATPGPPARLQTGPPRCRQTQPWRPGSAAGSPAPLAAAAVAAAAEGRRCRRRWSCCRRRCWTPPRPEPGAQTLPLRRAEVRPYRGHNCACTARDAPVSAGRPAARRLALKRNRSVCVCARHSSSVAKPLSFHASVRPAAGSPSASSRAAPPGWESGKSLWCTSRSVHQRRGRARAHVPQKARTCCGAQNHCRVWRRPRLGHRKRRAATRAALVCHPSRSAQAAARCPGARFKLQDMGDEQQRAPTPRPGPAEGGLCAPTDSVAHTLVLSAEARSALASLVWRKRLGYRVAPAMAALLVTDASELSLEAATASAAVRCHVAPFCRAR